MVVTAYRPGLRVFTTPFYDIVCKVAQFQPRKFACVISVLYLTNGFHVAVRMFSNRSQRTSYCGKKKNWPTSL